MLRLDTITRKLQVVLGALVTTNQLPVAVMYADKGAATYAGAASLANTNGITAVDIAAAPASAVVRHIDYLSVRNSDTVAATVTIRYNDNATLYVLNTTTLGVGEELTYTHASGWRVIDSGGATKTSQVAATTTFTGEVTGVGTGSVALTIASGAVTTTKILDAAVTTAKLLDTAVTYTKIQNVTATDKLLGRSTAGAGVVEEVPCTAAGRAVLAGADAVAQRATLGLVIGTNVQAYDADLAAIAALAGTSGLARKTAADTWTLDTSAYLTAEADTLAAVTGRGATTATALSITNATEATSTITGALTVSGGVGIAKNLHVGGIVAVPVGSAAAPSVTTPGATNDGLYFPSPGQVALAAGGVLKLQFDSGGSMLGSAELYRTVDTSYLRIWPSATTGETFLLMYGENAAAGNRGRILISAGNAATPTGTDNTLAINTSGVERLRISALGAIVLPYTNTATVGAVTIDKATGRVNIAAAGTSVVVTNVLVTAASHVNAWCSSADATARVTSVVPAAGSFTINTVATTAQTSFDFVVFSA